MREKLIELLKHDDCPVFLVIGGTPEDLADFLIANDVVPVVRCKDCKKAKRDEYSGCYFCGDNHVNSEHFCSYGERRSND